MNEYKFKTTLSCSGCVGKIEKFLNADQNILKWSVDLDSGDKILTVQLSHADPSVIPPLLLKAGYKAELMH